jgi:hypothetical protein
MLVDRCADMPIFFRVLGAFRIPLLINVSLSIQSKHTGNGPV